MGQARQSRTPPALLVLRATKETDLLFFVFPWIGSHMASAAWSKRWIRPEVWPLFAATGVAVGICGMQLIRNITGNPEVRVLKEKRAAGVLENHEEGKRYSQHFFRKFIDGRKPEIMQKLNSWMADPKE